MMAWIERACERYLASRGRVVLPRTFNGLAVGNCTVVEHGRNAYVVYPSAPRSARSLIGLNHSVLNYVRAV